MRKRISIILLLVGLVFAALTIYAERSNYASELYCCALVTCVIEFFVVICSRRNVGRNAFVSLMCLLALLVYKFTGMIIFVGVIIALTLSGMILCKLYIKHENSF